MPRFARRFVVLAALAAFLAFAGTASAAHQHWLETPGACVVDIASGQTSIDDAAHGGYHQFHDNVHIGVPGSSAFGHGPVQVGKDADGVCPGV